MTSEKKMMKSCSVFLIEQKMEFEKFNCFVDDFLRSSFGRIKVMTTMVEIEYIYTRHNQTYLLFISVDWFLYGQRFYRTVFPITIF